MATELFANLASSTLSAGIASTDTTLSVVSAASFPAAVSGTSQFRIVVDSEIMIVTNVSGTTFTVTRGAESTTAAAHSSGAAVTHVVTAGSLSAAYRSQAAIAARAYNTTGPSIPGVTATPIALNAESHKQGVTHDNVTNSSRLTIVTPGRYSVHGCISWHPSSSQLQARIHRNGSLTALTAVGSDAAGPSMHVSDSLVCAAGDYIELVGYCASATAIYSGESATFLAVTFDGA